MAGVATEPPAAESTSPPPTAVAPSREWDFLKVVATEMKRYKIPMDFTRWRGR